MGNQEQEIEEHARNCAWIKRNLGIHFTKLGILSCRIDMILQYAFQKGKLIMSGKIVHVHGREVLDSRGNPTVEAEVVLEGGKKGIGVAPSGASTGDFEALELRDGDKSRYMGKGVKTAISNIDGIIRNLIHEMDASKTEEIDGLMIKADGTKDKSKLGANAILAVSFACAKAAALEEGKEVYQFVGKDGNYSLPMHMDNCINGGVHCQTNDLDFQEFMIMPVGACCFKEGVRMCVEVYHTLKKLLEEDGHITSVGDEGGFAPGLSTAFEVFDYFMRAVRQAGYEPGKDIAFAMDAAASELYQPDSAMYFFAGETRALQRKKGKLVAKPDTETMQITRSTEEMIQLYEQLVEKYPLISIEDGLDQEDWKGWVELTKRLGDKVMLVGDDLFVTNVERLKKGVEMGAANAILIKPNQIGSLSETVKTVAYAKEHGYKTIMSHRSGETEDTIISDLAVGLDCGYMKTGAPCRGERTAKYNRLLRIEEELNK